MFFLYYFFFRLLAFAASMASFIAKRFFVLCECLDPLLWVNDVDLFAMAVVYSNYCLPPGV